MKVCLPCGQRFQAGGWVCPACGRSPAERGQYPAFAPDTTEAGDSYDAACFSRLATLETGNFWFEARNRLVVWALRRYFPAARNFLEIGCGTGFVLAGIQRAFPALALAGAEVFSEGLAHARGRAPGAALFQMDARQIPFEEEFDVIGAFDVLEHIEQDVAVLSEVFRAVRPGGGVMLTVPQHPFLWSRVDEHARHKRRYTRGELIDKVRRAGFEITRTTSFVSLLLPAMALSRVAGGAARRSDPLPELGMSTRMNAVLARVLAVERTLIERGVSFPAGGSLLLVARKGDPPALTVS
jgi:SAM-dependent methyltransferase